MRRRGLHALVLGAFLARVVLPAFHFHEEGGRGGECRHEAEHRGAAVEAAYEGCAVCELLAVKVPGLAPEAPPTVAASRPSAGERAHIFLTAPRSAVFSLVGAPRGPPASTPA
jgi:hypothetical protein